MSREQWGHGYWKGVNDAKNGNVCEHLKDEDVRDMAEMYVLFMCDYNREAHYNRSLFPVSRQILFCRIDGSSRYVMPIYNHILENQPFGCYVSGDPNGRPEDDYYVLPINLSENKVADLREQITRRWNARKQKEEKRNLQKRIEEMVKTNRDEITFSLKNYKPSSYWDVICSAIRNAILPWPRHERVKHFHWEKEGDNLYRIRRLS